MSCGRPEDSLEGVVATCSDDHEIHIALLCRGTDVTRRSAGHRVHFANDGRFPTTDELAEACVGLRDQLGVGFWHLARSLDDM